MVAIPEVNFGAGFEDEDGIGRHRKNLQELASARKAQLSFFMGFFGLGASSLATNSS